MADLEWGIKNGDIDVVKKIIEKDNAQVNKPTERGRYPLHYAADYNQPEVLNYLISQGADVNQTDKYGITPILAAIYEGHTESVKILLKRGANTSLKAPDGSSYIDCAESQSVKDLLK